MIQSIELKNFKSIKQHKFQLRNLNIIGGLNGMGKSTFIQSLLILRQSDRLPQGELKINGPMVNIGKTNDAFYQFGKDDTLVYDIAFQNIEKSKKFEFNYQKESEVFKFKHGLTLEDLGEPQKDFYGQSLFTKNFQYLSANRIEPKEIHNKSFTSVVDLRNVGNNGEYTIHFLEVYGSDDVLFKNLIHPNSVNNYLSEQVNKWMGEVSPGVKLNFTSVPNSDFIIFDVQFEQPNLGFTNRFKPNNVGFGISYSLPVVTALLAAQPGELIIIENPESHIHPRGQAELGRLIALTAMNDVQVIVETHSDHVINGIRVAIKEKEIDPDKVAMFYFERKIEEKEQYSNITNIHFDINGELSDYPNTLLDEWSNQLMKLV